MPGWWLASGDQRRLTGSGSALETLRDDVLYKWSRLLYFMIHEYREYFDFDAPSDLSHGRYQ